MAKSTFAKFEKKKVERFQKLIEKNLRFQKGNTKVWAIMGAIALQDVDDHFEKERGPFGKWQRWSDSYISHMIKTGKVANKVLQDGGRLRNSVLRGDDPRRISKGILLFNPAKVKGGFPYAKAHNLGGRKLPQREFMWLSLKAMNKIAKFTARYMAEGDKALK